MCLCNRNFHDSLPGKPINSWEINGSRIKEEAGHVSKLPLKFRKTPGGALGYFLGGYVPPGTPNWHPVLEKFSPKIDTPL